MPYVCRFSGAFAKLQKATVSFVMCVRLSDRPHGRTLMTFDIRVFFSKIFRKNQVSLKSDKNNGYFTSRPIYIFCHISVSSS